MGPEEYRDLFGLVGVYFRMHGNCCGRLSWGSFSQVHETVRMLCSLQGRLYFSVQIE